MTIEEIENFAVSTPLEEPVAFATRVVKQRDTAVVYICTDDGTEGLSYGGTLVGFG